MRQIDHPFILLVLKFILLVLKFNDINDVSSARAAASTSTNEFLVECSISEILIMMTRLSCLLLKRNSSFGVITKNML